MTRFGSRDSETWMRLSLALLLAIVFSLLAGCRRPTRAAYMLTSPASLIERSTQDRPDDVVAPQVHVVYAVASDGTDRRLDVDGTIARSVLAWNGWLARESGGGRIRLDTADGRLDVTFVRLRSSEAEYASEGPYVRDRIERELGLQAPHKMYAVYFDGPSMMSCGGSFWPPAKPGNVVALYLRGTPPGAPACAENPFAANVDAPGYLELAMLHEVFHGLGATAQCAPNHVSAGHVGDEARDLMYAGSQPWRPTWLDVGRNDYWGHGRADCTDVARSPFVAW